ncbi:MAG: PAS domain-containing sensor histidine kinase, partial [Gammaproteobacteria bacterium]
MTNRPDDRRPGGSGRRLVALLGLTLLFGALLAPLPLRIRAGNQAQRVLAALDAVRPPLLALERTTTRLVQAPEAPPGRFAARLRACDAAVARFTAAARLDRPTREAAGAFRDAYRKWRANLVRLREHLRTERRHDHAGRHLAALSAEFVRLLVTLAAAEQPLHRTMAAGRRAMNLAGTLAILYLLLAFLVVFRHQQRTAEAIRATGRRLEALLDQAPEATLLLDASGTVLEWNPAAERIFGWRRDEALGRPLHELIVPPRWQARYRACLQRLPALGGEAPARTLRSDRYSARHRDGRLLPVEFTLVPLQHEETLYAAFLRDLTELHRAQEELRLAAITFQTHAGIVITDAQGTILRVNPAYEAMTGYRAEELVGKNPRILQSGRQPPEFYARMWRDLLDKGQWQGELWNRRKDGRLYCQVLTITAVRDDEGRTTHYIGTSQDIT